MSINIIKWIKDNKKEIAVLFVMYVLQMSSIIRANFSYDDDLGRIIEGYAGNAYDSRYLADIISKAINANNRITDTSPLTQYLACFFLAVSVLVIIRVFSENSKIDIFSLAVAAIMVSPFFLVNFSYKIDSSFMALSVLLSVMPFLWKDNIRAYIIASAIGTFGVCMTYQASSGIYPMLVLMYAYFCWMMGKNDLAVSLKFTAYSATTYVLCMFFFKTFLMREIEDGYISNSVPDIKSLIPTFIRNITKIYRTIIADFSKMWNILIALLVVIFIFNCLRSSSRKLLANIVYLMITLVFILLLVVGPYVILERPLIEARSLYGFSVMLTILGAVILSFDGIKAVIGRGVLFILGWCLFAFSFTYGNALAEQMKYTDFRVEEIINDLTDLPNYIDNDERQVEIKGSIGLAPAVDCLNYDYVLIKEIPIYIDSVNSWGTNYYFYNYYNLTGVLDECGMGKDQFELVQESAYHKIYNRDNQFIVELK